MLACTALVGCTNNDEPANNGSENGKQDAYVKVRLVMTDTAGSRSAEGGKYEVGEEYEQRIDINKTIFLFYNESGEYIASGHLTKPYNLSENHGSNTNQGFNDKHGDAIIALSAPDESILQIKQVLTIANYSKTTDLENKPLSYALEQVAENATDPAAAGTDENSAYLMSTSAYFTKAANQENDVDGDLLCNTTKITEQNIKNTEKEALLDGVPVDIYIERAAAKVELLVNNATINKDNSLLAVAPSSENSGDANKDADIYLDNVLTPVNVQILGWSINNYNENTNLVKKFDDSWNHENSPLNNNYEWNYPEDFRSYYAMGTQWDYSGYVTVGENTSVNHPLTVKTFAEATGNYNPMYCYEHTVETNNIVADRTTAVAYPNVTTILVAGQIIPAKEGAVAQTLYKYSGVFYTLDNYKKLIKSRLTTYKKSDGNFLQEEEWIVNVSTPTNGSVDAAFNVIVGVASGVTLAEEDALTEINKNIETIAANTQVYTEGKCYYQIPIEHLSSTDNKKLYGVVRNHWYKLNITAVNHIGEPVYDIDNPIPTIPEKDITHYLAAKLHVLSWKVVNQGVVLE